MGELAGQARIVSGAASGGDRVGQADDIGYTIATLVNDRAQYDAMVASFHRGGFGFEDCEFVCVDNTGDTQTCAYRGLNALMREARGRYVVLCHQDVRLIKDGRADLDARLDELEAKDADWAVAGNAGGVRAGKLAIRISDPHGVDQHVGQLPARVMSVDENFIVVKRASGIGFSHDLTGFHLYGADLCLNADVLGWRSYVIDFHLQHLSAGNKDASFSTMEKAFCDKWDRVLGSRLVQTTCTLLWVGGPRERALLRRAGEFVVKKALRVASRVGGWRLLPLSGRRDA